MSKVTLLQKTGAKVKQSSSDVNGAMLLKRERKSGSSSLAFTGRCVERRSSKPLQAKLMLSADSDPMEQEADQVADQIVRESADASVDVKPPRIQHLTGQQTGRLNETPASVDRVLSSSGKQLEHTLKHNMEMRFGHDFSRVRIHVDAAAEQSAQDVRAKAYTVGHSIVFGPGQFVPHTRKGQRLLAHELTHVIQQSRVGGIDSDRNHTAFSSVPLHREELKDAGVDDEPLPGGVRDPITPRRPADMSDGELGTALIEAQNKGDSARVEAIEAEMEDRFFRFGTAAPRGPGPVTSGVGAVTPDVALKLLDNMSRGEPAFKPELGLGGCSWFTTEGTPYAGTGPEKSINVQVEINKGTKPLVFKEADLLEIFEAEKGPAEAQAQAEYRAKFNIDPNIKLSNRALKAINRTLKRFTEKRMWTRVGEKVAASANKVGEVVLEPGGTFSDAPGKFAVVADASKMTLKGGVGPIVDALAKEGITAEPVTVEAAEALAKSMKWAGRVRGVFRYGGRVLIVVGITLDAIRIYRAQDKLKATLTSVAGWAGATAAGAAFAAYWTPADVAGPWAWAVHGVGTLVAGGIGYWIGSETTRYIYELAVEP